MRKIPKYSNKGFIALIAVILLSSGITAVSLALLNSAVQYADMVSVREFRIQARLNAEACLDTMMLMVSRNYYLSGSIMISEFECKGMVSNDGTGHIEIVVDAEFGGVNGRVSGEVYLRN